LRLALDGLWTAEKPCPVPTKKREDKADAELVGRALDRLRAVVHAKDLKNSQVREAIARAALEHGGHFTVEELVRSLRHQGITNVHVATVYRAIPLLVEAGLIQQSLLSEGDTQHFERSFERDHHDHLICSSCGALVEFHSEGLEALQREIAERHGYTLESHVHELRGICSICRTSN
jgi:Fur family transcriptional regulator, ferric uptake regulator